MKLKNLHNLSWDSLSNKGSFFLVVVCLWPLGCSCLPFTCYALVMSDCQLFSRSAAVLKWIRYSGWATTVEKLKCTYEKAVLDNNRPFSMTAVIRTWCFCPMNCVHDDTVIFFLDCWGLSCGFRFHSTPRCWTSFIYRYEPTMCTEKMAVKLDLVKLKCSGFILTICLSMYKEKKKLLFVLFCLMSQNEYINLDFFFFLKCVLAFKCCTKTENPIKITMLIEA